MVAATTVESRGRKLEEKIQKLIAQPPTIEVMREIVAAMLTEVRLPFPNFQTLLSLLPEIEEAHKKLLAEYVKNTLATAQNISEGRLESAFDDTLPGKANEVQKLIAQLKKEIEDRAERMPAISAHGPPAWPGREPPARSARPFDSPTEIPQDLSMSTPTREEIDAKLEAMEARMDGRVAAIQASIDGFTGRMEERFARADDRAARLEETVRDTQASIGNLKSTIITTAIATVLAIVLGVAAFNATVLSNMVATFESGKNTAASQAEVKRQTEETAALLKQLQQQMDSAKQSTPPAQK